MDDEIYLGLRGTDDNSTQEIYETIMNHPKVNEVYEQRHNEVKPKVVVNVGTVGYDGKSLVRALAAQCDIAIWDSKTQNFTDITYDEWEIPDNHKIVFDSLGHCWHEECIPEPEECRGAGGKPRTNTKKVGKHNYPFWYKGAK